MVEVLKTENEKLTVKTVWIEKEKTFSVIFCYPNGKEFRVEDFKNILILVQTHDFWCKYTGIISTKLKISQVKKHLTDFKLRAV